MDLIEHTESDRIRDLLAEHGVGLSVTEVEEIAAGVASAPGRNGSAWMRLIAPRPNLALRRHLQRLVDDHRRAVANPPSPREVRSHLGALRAEMRRIGLDGLIVPHADAHQSEQLPACEERLAWLTGFAGSAGVAVVLHERAALFVDGRYTVQAARQVDTGDWQLHHLIDAPPADWIAMNLEFGDRLGYDPWLHTQAQVEAYAAACARAGARLIAVRDNPVDAVWKDRPLPPFAPITIHPERFAGRSAREKREEIAEMLRRDRQDAAILSAPDAIAWLLNIRGGEVPYTPVTLAFAILRADASVSLFVDPRKLARGVRAHLGDEVTVAAPEAFAAALDALGSERRRVRFMTEATPAWVVQRLKEAGANVLPGSDPCALPKARKQKVELDGIRAAHRRDGAALCRFLHWLDVAAADGQVTEVAAAERLEAFRQESANYCGPSFATISAAGGNAAIVHYRAMPESDQPLRPHTLYLVDSGGQYPDGTTDVTRTVAIGTPTDEMRARFTLVLKGHIAIATARFPKGTTGPQIDTLARLPLWQAGLDYDHGTGHGVGHYLNVHEGPQRIAKLPNRVPLEPGMVISNEPGYYKLGAYGIRIENLVTVIPVGSPPGGERPLLGFETLTLAPIDLRLVEPSLLSPAERAWLNAYHARVRRLLIPLVDPDTAAWLDLAARELRH